MPPPIIQVEVNSIKANRQIKSIKKNLADLNTMVNRIARNVKTVDFSQMGKGATGNLRNMAKAATVAATAQGKLGKGLKDVGKASDKAGKQTRGLNKNVTALSKSIQVALGPLSGVAARLTAFVSLGSGLNFVIAGIVAGFIALSAIFIKTVQAGREMEERMFAIQQVINITGQAAGRSAVQIEALAQSVATSTLASINDIRSASAVLLTFVSVTGKAFDRTIRLAQDLAQLGFGSARNAAVQLGKALEDPKAGLSALRRVGVSFTRQLRDQIIEMAELGRTAEAVELILSNLESQVGGVGEAAAQGLSGALDRLGDNFTRFFELLGQKTETLPGLTALFTLLNVRLEALNERLEPAGFESLSEGVEEANVALAKHIEFVKEQNLAQAMAGVMLGMNSRNFKRLSENVELANEAFADFLEDLEDQQVGDDIREAIKAANLAQLGLDALTDTFEKLEDRVLAGAKAQRDFAFGIKVIDEIVKSNDANVRALIPTLEKELELRRALAVQLENALASTRFLSKAEREAQKQAGQANRILKRMLDTRNKAFETTEQQIDSILRESKALLISGKERKVALEVLKAEIRLKKVGIDVTREEIKQLLKRVEESARLREQVKEAVRDETEALKDFSRIIGTAFEDALTKGGTFRELIAGIEEDLIRLVTRIAITKPFEAAFTSAIEGGKLEEGAEGIEQLGFKLGETLRDIFGFGNQEQQEKLAKDVETALAKEEAARGKFAITTGGATTQVQLLADAALKASIALNQLVKVTAGDVPIPLTEAQKANAAFQKALPGGGFGGPDDEGMEDAVQSGVERGFNTILTRTGGGFPIGGGPGGPDDAGQEFTGAAKRLIDAIDDDIAALKLEVQAKRAAEIVTTIQTAAVQAETVATNTLTPALTAAAAAANSFAVSAGGGSGGGIGGAVSSIFGGGSATPGADFTAANIDFLGFTAKGGVLNRRGRVPIQSLASGGIADRPSVAVFGEKPGQKEAFVPLPSGDKIPVDLRGDVGGGGITINGPLMVVEARDAESFEQSDTQIASGIVTVLQRAQRNM